MLQSFEFSSCVCGLSFVLQDSADKTGAAAAGVSCFDAVITPEEYIHPNSSVHQYNHLRGSIAGYLWSADFEGMDASST